MRRFLAAAVGLLTSVLLVSSGVNGGVITMSGGRGVPVPTSGGGGGDGVLLTHSNFTAAGSFTLPASGYDYGGGTLAILPGNKMTVAGTYPNKLGIINIPSLGGTATNSTAPVTISGNVSSQSSGMADQMSSAASDGSFIYYQKLQSYDGGGDTTASIARASMTLGSQTSFKYFTTAPNKRFTGGLLAPIPAEHQAALGGNMVVGGAPLSIISSASNGPSLYSWNTSDWSTTPIPIQHKLMEFQYPNSLKGTWSGSLSGETSEIWNYNDFPFANVAFIDGTDTMVFFTWHGDGPTDYKNEATPGTPDPCDPDNGGGQGWPDYLRVYLFDVNDFKAVIAGTKNPQDVRAYEWFNMPGFTSATCTTPEYGGLAYDASTQRLYFTPHYGGGTAKVYALSVSW